MDTRSSRLRGSRQGASSQRGGPQRHASVTVKGGCACSGRPSRHREWQIRRRRVPAAKTRCIRYPPQAGGPGGGTQPQGSSSRGGGGRRQPQGPGRNGFFMNGTSLPWGSFHSIPQVRYRCRPAPARKRRKKWPGPGSFYSTPFWRSGTRPRRRRWIWCRSRSVRPPPRWRPAG